MTGRDRDAPPQIKELDAAHEALNRMRRAYRRGTGCHLTAEMIHSLSCTLVGGLWEQDDPRHNHPSQERGRE